MTPAATRPMFIIAQIWFAAAVVSGKQGCLWIAGFWFGAWFLTAAFARDAAPKEMPK